MTRIIDSHCHIYPEKIALRAVNSVEDFYDHLPRKPWNGTSEELVRSGLACGITHFVVFSVATTPHQVSSINRFIAGEVQAHPGVMTGLGTMHLDSDDYARDLKEIQDLGLKGVKLHPDIQKFEADDPRAMEIYAMCEGKMVVCIHAGDHRYGYSNPDRISRILEAFPRLQLIAAHMGGWSLWEEAAERLSPYPNCLVDCSSTFYWLDHEKALKVIRKYGANRVLFGTDYPFWPQGPELEDLMYLGLKDEELEDICWRNAARLYDLHFEENRT